MQENLAPHRWWKLGKSLEIYVFRRCYILHVLLICPWVKAHNLQHPSLQVCCDECQIWVHVECDLTCINMEDLENADYFCPDCKSKRKTVPPVEQMNTPNSSECASTSKEKLPEMIPVFCFGMDGMYLPKKHMYVFCISSI
jgi:hypothetical protein